MLDPDQQGQNFPVLNNPTADRVKSISGLSQRSVRNRRRQFLVEGPQAVREALRYRAEYLQEIYASEEFFLKFPEFPELVAQSGVRLRIATDQVLAAMSDTVQPQGIVAVCRFFEENLGEVLGNGPQLIAALCRVQDPGNAGTILRVADAVGADAVVLTTGSVDLYNPKLVRSTAGSLFHLPVILGVEVAALAQEARGAGLDILAADGYGELALPELNGLAPGGGRPTLWLFGNEAQGLSAEEKALADYRVAVPIYGKAESLNVATAATVCLYHSAVRA